MAIIIEMPKLSDTMSVGTLVKWHKKIGDVVENGDILAEVETDKATMELQNLRGDQIGNGESSQKSQVLFLFLW